MERTDDAMMADASIAELKRGCVGHSRAPTWK